MLQVGVRFPAPTTKGNRSYIGSIGEGTAVALRDYFECRMNDLVTKDMHGRHYTLTRRPVGDDSFVFESRNGEGAD